MAYISLCDHINMKYSTAFFTYLYPTTAGSAANKIISKTEIMTHKCFPAKLKFEVLN